MRAVTRRLGPDSYTHGVTIGEHQLTADEPVDKGGDDRGPTPQEMLAASLASCVAITIEMYAQRKGWDVGLVEVECAYSEPERGAATLFELVLRLPDTLDQHQRERLRDIAARCPVHRTLEGPVVFEDRVELQPTT